MIDHLNIGCTPYDENCFPAGHPKARRECQIFLRQLQRQFPGADLRVKGFPHDFGTYYEVCAFYNDKESMNLAFQVESESPGKWDEIAKAEMQELTESE